MSAENRSEAFTTGKEATRESIRYPGRYTTDIAFTTGKGLGTSTVSHGWDTRPKMPRQLRRMPEETRAKFAEGGININDGQGTLFRPRRPTIDMWHGTPHPDSKLAKAYALGHAYNLAKKASGGLNPIISTARTKDSTDAANRVFGTDDEPTITEGNSRKELNEYGNSTARGTAESIDKSLKGPVKFHLRKDVNSRVLNPEDIAEARNTAANAKKIAKGQKVKGAAQRRIDTQLDKAKKNAGIQPTLPGFER